MYAWVLLMKTKDAMVKKEQMRKAKSQEDFTPSLSRAFEEVEAAVIILIRSPGKCEIVAYLINKRNLLSMLQ